jgi:hypothetical protein
MIWPGGSVTGPTVRGIGGGIPGGPGRIGVLADRNCEPKALGGGFQAERGVDGVAESGAVGAADDRRASVDARANA